MANLVKNYVDALYSLINNNTDRDQLEKDLKSFVAIYNSDDTLKRVLSDPRIEIKTKYEILDEIFSKSNVYLTNFIKLLVKEKHINLVSDIKIIVSSEIDDNQIDKIIQKFKSLYKVNTVNYSIEIDKSILGGIKIIVGNTVYDASVKRQLEQIF